MSIHNNGFYPKNGVDEKPPYEKTIMSTQILDNCLTSFKKSFTIFDQIHPNLFDGMVMSGFYMPGILRRDVIEYMQIVGKNTVPSAGIKNSNNKKLNEHMDVCIRVVFEKGNPVIDYSVINI